MSTTDQKPSWSYRVTQYFLRNHRLTALLFVFVIMIGVVATFTMRTTGFPNPEIKLVLIQTPYLGAASETVAEQVTQPLEGAIKDIDGVDTFSSRSQNSFSLIQIEVADNADANVVRSKIDSAVRSVELPDGAEDSNVSIPNFGGGDIILSVASKDAAALYAAKTSIQDRLTELSSTGTIDIPVDMTRSIKVVVHTDELANKKITLLQIQDQLSTVGEAIPATTAVPVDDDNQSVVTVSSEKTLDDLRQMVIQPETPATKKIVLDDIADINESYNFEDNQQPQIGLQVQNLGSQVLPAATLYIHTTDGTDMAAYTAEVEALLKDTPNTEFVGIAEGAKESATTYVIENYSSNEFNQRQVNEVVSGLVGGPLDTDGVTKNLGWLLGGIQLVFLVMLAFVSWRAAIVAALAIPLSLMFANIYLYVTGNDLNTLVLFSLVLVIGLVVDPALVILESIQRKVDAGLKGRAAALAAVKDVGSGLFLATVTNVIVFAPFGLISGLLGQIFKYIPLTIIPAVVGSYIVPLVFLAWIGGLFLKRSKGATDDEEHNLMGVARWLIRLNSKILHSSAWLRLAIIIVAFALPFAVTGYYVSSGKILMVQFAATEDADHLDLGFTHFPAATTQQKADTEAELFTKVLDEPLIKQIFPLAQNGAYYGRLTKREDRPDETAVMVADRINTHLADTEKKFFNSYVRIESIGPPRAAYDVSLAIASPNADDRKSAAVDIGNTFQNICLDNKVVTVTDTCAGERIINAIDDGYTNKEQTVIEVVLNREALEQKQLALPNAPLGIAVNQAIQNAFAPNAGKAIADFEYNGEATDIIFDTSDADPNTIDEIKDIVLYISPVGEVTLDDVADVQIKPTTAVIQRVNGKTISVVQARLVDDHSDQATAAMVSQAVLDYYQNNNGEQLESFHLEASAVDKYSEGSEAAAAKSFQDLFTALGLSIVLTYIVLAVFFNSFTQPVVILFTLPLTFLGIFPALAMFTGGQFGFLEIIGLIILVGLVENVAIFLIDAARQKIEHDGWDEKRAISYASGVRLRPVLMTKFTAVASLMPLAIMSETYRSISVVIMAGLLTSGFFSLITTPIFFIFFRRVSAKLWKLLRRG